MEQPWILSEAAQVALAFAGADSAGDALRLSADLERRFGLAPDQRAQVLTQVALRDRAAGRWGDGDEARALLYTRDGLEQATRPALAAWRAARLRAFGVERIADLGCGLGLESRAFARAGLRVTAIERDALVAGLAAHNIGDPATKVVVGDITSPEILEPTLAEVDAVFLDPARRDSAAPRSIDGLSGHRVAHPEEWSPPWSWILGLAARVPRTVVKVAPGIHHGLIPEAGSAVWAAVDGDLVEASVWFPGFERQPRRSALSIAYGGTSLLDSDMPTDEAVTPLREFLLDVAPVVTRSGLVTTLAASIQATRIDEHIGYLTSAHAPAPSPSHTTYRVLDDMPFDRKRIGDALHALECGPLTVMKRGFAADTEQLRKQWLKRCNGNRAITVALTRIGDAPTAIICEH